MKKGTLTGVFIAAASVGGAHYGITGFEDVLNSVDIGLTGGFGALVMDVFHSWRSESSESRDAKNESTPIKPDQIGPS